MAADLHAQKAEYEAIVSSGVFPPHTNPARLLRYVADCYFKGERDVSEYAIAVDALGRRKDFDPKQDAIVRVEAHRVRKRLSEYYEAEGAAHEIRLVIPPGSYLPVFVPRDGASALEAAPGLPPETPIAPEHARRRQLLLLAAVCAVCVVATVILLVRTRASVPPAPSAPAAPPAATAAAGFSELRILAGASAGYKDRLGRVWSADRYFHGGEAWAARYRRIFRTQDPQLFLTCRQGTEFGYDIPLPPGSYELRLYFAETFYGDDNTEGGGESSRMFTVTANGVPLLHEFDPLSDAGGSNTADARVFSGISPASDGKLHLQFSAQYQLKSVAILNGIEIVAGGRPGALPVRWVASDSAVVDSAGRLWQPDQFSNGGRIRIHTEPVENAAEPALYRTERYGHFTYAIPVPQAATYTLRLYFSEHWFGLENFGGKTAAGMRVFDVYSNGVALLRNFDIAREAGGPLKSSIQTFRGLHPNAQGKLVLSFVPIRDYACLNALEVAGEREGR
jgi:hypothetical protein